MNFYKYLKNFTCFILLYTILFTNTSIFYVFANEINQTTTEQKNNENNKSNEPTDMLGLTAQFAVLIDAKTGIVIYDKNKDEKVYPASTTKILTALLAIENTKPTDILKHSYNAIFNIGPGSSNIGMRENEQITMEQALYGVLLASANEVCMAIAEHISGSVDKFVELMNKTVKEIGAKNTNFANPHGFHDENHYTTSYDMALIMKEAIKNKDFINYISTPNYKIPPTNIVNEERILNNSNRLILTTSPYYYEYCIGGKTGFTNEAGHTLVTYAKKDNIELIAVVMKDERFKIYNDTKTLFEYGFSMYEQKNIFNKDDYKHKLEVIQKFKEQQIPLGEIYISAEEDLDLYLPKNVDITKIQKVANMKSPAIAPIKKGQKVGTLDFMYEGNKIYSINLIADDKMDIIDEAKLELQEKIKKTFNIIKIILKYSLIGILIFGGIFLLVAFITRNIIKTKRKNRRKNIYKGLNKKNKRK